MIDLIGFHGPAKSGKDTAADYLVREHGYHKLRFADPMKIALGFLFKRDFRNMDQDEKERIIPELGVSPRYIMQTFGTDWGRHMIGPDVWVYVFQRELEEVDAEKVVVPDVRFPNEAKLIHDLEGAVVKLDRPGAGTISHESEMPLLPSDVDWVIYNHSDFDDLYNQIENFLNPEPMPNFGGDLA